MLYTPDRRIISPPALFNVNRNYKSEEMKFLEKCKDINFYFKMTGFSPTWQQKEFVDAFVAGEPNIAVRSGKGPGKTCVTANCIPWWSLTNYMSRAITTAPTMRQCKDQWLAEAKRWVVNGDPRLSYFIKFTTTTYRILGHDPAIWGCLLATATKPENLQGIHSKKLLIYCEEASGISAGIMQTIQDTLSGLKEKGSGAHNRWVAIGNPNTRTCRFFDFFNSLSGKPWYPLRWNAEETPESEWFSYARNEEIAEEFGRDSDIYRIAVLGEFPEIDHDVVISYKDVANAYGKEALSRVLKIKDTKKQIGIDLARWGGDELALVFRQGGILLHSEYKANVEIAPMIRKADEYQKRMQWKDAECTYVIDTDGMGQGAVSFVSDSQTMGKQVYEFHTNGKPAKKAIYANTMSEAYFQFASKLRRGEIYLGDKMDKKLVDQLCNRKYSTTPDGLLLVERKKEYVKRMMDQEHGSIGKSPDRAEAVVMAFYDRGVISQIG